jgi:hypothetical protein
MRLRSWGLRPAPLRTAITLFVLAPALVLMTGCELDSDWNRYTEDFHYSYPLTANGRVEVENGNGQIEISGWDQPNVDVSGTKYASNEESLKNMRVDVDASANSVLVRTYADSGWSNRAVHYVIRVPRNAQLKRIINSNGPVRLDAVDSGATIRTSNGPVHANHIRGALEIETSNGPVEVTGLSGSAGIRTSNGPVQLTLDAAAAVRAETSNGPITIHVPEDAGGEVRARTSNGPIHTDFDLKSGGYISKNSLEGTFGGGGPLLDLSTSNGPIRIAKL